MSTIFLGKGSAAGDNTSPACADDAGVLVPGCGPVVGCAAAGVLCAQDISPGWEGVENTTLVWGPMNKGTEARQVGGGSAPSVAARHVRDKKDRGQTLLA